MKWPDWTPLQGQILLAFQGFILVAEGAQAVTLASTENSLVSLDVIMPHNPCLRTENNFLGSETVWSRDLNTGVQARKCWAPIPALTLTCCVASDKPLNSSLFLFPPSLKWEYYHSPTPVLRTD